MSGFADGYQGTGESSGESCVTVLDLKQRPDESWVVQHEFLKRTEQLAPTIVNTMTTFLRRASYSIINTSSIPPLLKHIQNTSSNKATDRANAIQATRLMGEIARYTPALCKGHVGELCKVVAGTDGKGKGKAKGGDGEHALEVAVMALANLVKWDEKIGAMIDKKTNERIMSLALGTEWRRAKFAARYLAFCKNKATLCASLVEVGFRCPACPYLPNSFGSPISVYSSRHGG